MSKIDLKYKIPLVGEYWAGISTCPKCSFRPDRVTTEIIGFAETINGVYAVVECPKCFKKWHFHARNLDNGIYKNFKIAIDFNEQKHFSNEK